MDIWNNEKKKPKKQKPEDTLDKIELSHPNSYP